MLRRFVGALCRSDHLDKVSVHAVLVDVFNTFQSALYRIELRYAKVNRRVFSCYRMCSLTIKCVLLLTHSSPPSTA